MTSPENLDLTEIACQLHEARVSTSPIDFVTSTLPHLTWDNARAIARTCDELRRSDGETQVGWKLGWTSTAMREALGIDRPNWGTLWDSQVCGPELALDAFIHPKIEPELVWRAPVDLMGDVDAEEVASCGGEWALGIEVVDPRFLSFNFQALDNTADNSSSAAIRLGEFSASEADVEVNVDDLLVTFSDTHDSRSGRGSLAMGSPWEAIAWLARSLALEDLSIRKGDIVFTGGLTAPFDAKRGTTYGLAGSPLDATAVRFV